MNNGKLTLIDSFINILVHCRNELNVAINENEMLKSGNSSMIENNGKLNAKNIELTKKVEEQNAQIIALSTQVNALKGAPTKSLDD